MTLTISGREGLDCAEDGVVLSPSDGVLARDDRWMLKVPPMETAKQSLNLASLRVLRILGAEKRL